MNILYLSCHSVLEHQELTILTGLEKELGIDVFSMGAYANPTQEGDFLRSVIPHGKFNHDMYQVYMQCDKDNIHDEMLEWADVVFMMHNSMLPNQKELQPWLANNWKKFRKHNNIVVWRAIGQSTPDIEFSLHKYRDKGLKIVRYSPLEKNIPNYAGEDVIIRFSEDEDEYSNWNGERKHVITVSQSMKKRGDHLGFDIFQRATSDFKRKVYGTGNADLGEMNGGQRSHEELKRDYRDARVFFYFGTVPAPYTMTFVEAMMTGTPIVAVGSKLRSLTSYPWQQYEIPEIINHGVNGFIGDTIDELKGYIDLLMNNDDKAKRISEAARKRAMDLFGRKGRMKEWSKFISTLR